MLQQEKPQDFVIATGEQYSVRQFIEWCCEYMEIEIEFSGKGIDEIGVVKSVNKSKNPALSIGDTIVKVDPRYFRPAEVETLLGDPSKAKKELGWKPEISAIEMCHEMMNHDLLEAEKKCLAQK